MAYFSNGSEGLDYEEQYCSNCIHRPDYEKSVDCPILALHSKWNYEQCGGDKISQEKKRILESFIPTKADGLFADQCKMFMEEK